MLVGGLEVRLAPAGEKEAEAGSASSNEALADRSEALLAAHAVCFLGFDGWQLDAVLMRCQLAAQCFVLDPADGTSSAAAAATAATPSSASAHSTSALGAPALAAAAAAAVATPFAATAAAAASAEAAAAAAAAPSYHCVAARSVSGALRRRFYQVARCRDAKVVGVVVGTLGVRHYKEVHPMSRQKHFF
jgi:hypothetical protein